MVSSIVLTLVSASLALAQGPPADVVDNLPPAARAGIARGSAARAAGIARGSAARASGLARASAAQAAEGAEPTAPEPTAPSVATEATPAAPTSGTAASASADPTAVVTECSTGCSADALAAPAPIEQGGAATRGTAGGVLAAVFAAALF